MTDRSIFDKNKDVEMANSGNLIRVILIILFLATPALIIRFISSYYDVPHLQPLALTRESLAATEEGQEGNGLARIDVHVGWGRDWTGTMTQTRLRDVISASLDHQTEYYHFDFKDMPGTRIDITFAVGPNRYGPFPPDRFVSGMKSALIALRMTNGPER